MKKFVTIFFSILALVTLVAFCAAVFKGQFGLACFGLFEFASFAFIVKMVA